MLTELASPAALLAAAIFLVAASAKLRSRSSTRAAVAAFGLPTVVSVVLAPVEIATGLAILVTPRIGAVLAAGLLVLFSIVVIRSLRRGVAVRCGCFGGTDQRRVGIDTMIRNLFLLVLTIVAGTASGTLSKPTLPAMVAVGSGAIAATLIVALVRLGDDVGSVFGQRLDGLGDRS